MNTTAKKELFKTLLLHELNCIKNNPKFQNTISAELFNPRKFGSCIYGQVFGRSDNEYAKRFRRDNFIPACFKFSEDKIVTEGEFSALEVYTYEMWERGEKEECMSLLRDYITFAQKY